MSTTTTDLPPDTARLDWIEILAGRTIWNATHMAWKVDGTRGSGFWYDGRPLTDTEVDAVVMADRLLHTVARIPGMDAQARCDACSRQLTELAVEHADGDILNGYVSGTVGYDDVITHCPFCQLDFEEAIVHAPTFSDRALEYLETRYVARRPSHQVDLALAAVRAELDARRLATRYQGAPA